jgi:hypothetical protein
MKTLTYKKVNGEKRGRKPFEIPKGVNVDWSLTNQEIAKGLNTSLMTVLLLRKRLGIPPHARGRPAHKPDLAIELKKALEEVYARFERKLTVNKT